MNRSFLKIAAATLLIGTLAGQAQADPVWHFPYKGQPYATNDASAHTTSVRKFASRAPRERSYYAQTRQSNPSLGGRAGSTPAVRSASSKIAPQS
jgi:hypothetical protein